MPTFKLGLLIMADIENLQSAFDIIREVKKIIEPASISNPTVISALVGAAVGGLMPIIVNICNQGMTRNQKRHAVTHQIYSEVSAILTVIDQRKYILSIKNAINYMQLNPGTSPPPLQIQVRDDLFHIYKANLDNLSLLDPKLQSEIVIFYHYLMALIEDVRPGGVLNTQPTLYGYNEFLDIALDTVKLGKKLQCELSFDF